MAAVAAIRAMSPPAAPAASSDAAMANALRGSSPCNAPATAAPLISLAAAFCGSAIAKARAAFSSR